MKYSACLVALFIVCTIPIAHATRPYLVEALQIEKILKQPEGQIDLARTKLLIDKIVDPSTDIEATLGRLDTIVARIRKDVPMMATSQAVGCRVAG